MLQDGGQLLTRRSISWAAGAVSRPEALNPPWAARGKVLAPRNTGKFWPDCFGARNEVGLWSTESITYCVAFNYVANYCWYNDKSGFIRCIFVQSQCKYSFARMLAKKHVRRSKKSHLKDLGPSNRISHSGNWRKSPLANERTPRADTHTCAFPASCSADCECVCVCGCGCVGR